MKRPSTQSPFAQCRRYRQWRDVDRLFGGRYPSFLALTDSCVNPITSPQLRLSLACRVFAGCHQPLLLTGSSRPEHPLAPFRILPGSSRASPVGRRAPPRGEPRVSSDRRASSRDVYTNLATRSLTSTIDPTSSPVFSGSGKRRCAFHRSFPVQIPTKFPLW
jgi:hypothetical protein